MRIFYLGTSPGKVNSGKPAPLRSVHQQLGMITLQIMPNILFNWKTMWTMINSLILAVGLLNSTVICGKQTHASHDLVWWTKFLFICSKMANAFDCWKKMSIYIWFDVETVIGHDHSYYAASVLKSRKSLVTLPPNHDFFTKDFHDTLAHLDSMRGLCFSSHYWP